MKMSILSKNTKYVCSVCGYVHQGNDVPEICPKCNQPKFQKVSDKMDEGLFSSKNRKTLLNPVIKDNALVLQALAICSALAVTVKMEPAIIMGVSVTICLGTASLITSVIRNYIPPSIRIVVQLVIIALLVITVDQFLKAYFYDVSKQLSVYVGLIITNCIIMGRLEAFAMGNRPWQSFLDGLGNGAGYAVILVAVAFFRELFGSGTLTLPAIGELQIVPQIMYSIGYLNNNLMILPPMALIIIGIFIWIHKAYILKK
jgi:Na+-transporting NADH:ubiquinone oxidoreductase subunit D